MEKRKTYVLDISKLDQKIVEKRYKNTGFITLDSGRKIPIPEIKKEAYKKYEWNKKKEASTPRKPPTHTNDYNMEQKIWYTKQK